MLLVGSKALTAYMPINRIVHDWDLWMSNYEYNEFLLNNRQFLVKTTPGSSIFDIKGTIVEIKKESQFEPTDRKIWELTIFNENSKEIQTPWGKAKIPSIQLLYIMKCATAKCIDEWKHHYDQKLIESIYSDKIEANTELYKERLAETEARITYSKKKKHEFFHKNAHNTTKIATIPEYIVHDKLHEMIADLCGINMPTYIRMISGDVTIELDLFNKLTYNQKISLMAEESLVLALERWFIPQMIENGINYKLVDMFYNNNEASPTYALLKHVNIKGLIGEKPEIVQFGRDNFNEIEKYWVWCKDQIKKNGGFPQWFYDEIFAAREKYRNGEKVGIHHG